MAYEVFRLKRRMAAAGVDADLELRNVALELAVACNVLELSPGGRIEAGSLVHERMTGRLDALLHRLDALDEKPVAA